MEVDGKLIRFMSEMFVLETKKIIDKSLQDCSKLNILENGARKTFLAKQKPSTRLGAKTFAQTNFKLVSKEVQSFAFQHTPANIQRS